MLAAAALHGCSAPCMEGFSKDEAGVCRADESCPAGTARGEDLVCHSTDEDLDADDVDTGLGSPGSVDSGGADTDDSGSTVTEGPGRIRVIWDGLSGVPLHGVVVMATRDGDPEPVAAMCVVVLQQEIDIDEYLVAYVPGEDPCIPGRDPLELDPGRVEVNMQVVAGEGGVPVLCDERDLVVAGDVTVDFSGVQSCDL